MDVAAVEKLDWRDSQGLPRKARCANVQYCAVAMWLREDSFIPNWHGKEYRRQR